MTQRGTNIILGIVAVVAIFALLWGAWKVTSTSTPEQSSKPIDLPVNTSDMIKGNPDSPMTLVEYSDFQCPTCRLYAPIVKSLVEKNGDLRLVYRHFPLEQHQYSRHTARAAEAAGKQDAFFPMHDLIFEKQDEWKESKDIDKTLLEHAASLKLDIAQFKKDYESAAVQKKVQDDYNSGIGYGVGGTPTFFLNGVQLEKLLPLDEFQKLIDEEREKVGISTPSGTIEPTKS